MAETLRAMHTARIRARRKHTACKPAAAAYNRTAYIITTPASDRLAPVQQSHKARNASVASVCTLLSLLLGAFGVRQLLRIRADRKHSRPSLIDQSDEQTSQKVYAIYGRSYQRNALRSPNDPDTTSEPTTSADAEELPSSYGEHKEARREPDNASAQPELKQSALPLTPHASAAEVSFDCISQAFADHHSSASAGFGTAEAVALPSEDMHTSGQQQDGTRIDQLEHAVHALRSRIEQVEASEVESSEAIVEVQSRLQQLNMQYNDSLASIEERLQYVEAASLSTPSEAEDLREELHEVRNTARSTLERLKAIEDGLAATDQRVRAVSGEAHQLADRMHLHEKSRGDSVPTHSLSGGEGDELHALQQRVQMIQPKPSDHIAKDSINSTADEILQRLEWFDQAGDPPKAPQLSDAETHELRTLRQQLQSPYSATATAAQCVNHSVAPVSPSQKHDPSSVHGNPHQHNHADTRDAANSGMRVSSETYADWKQSVIDQKAQPASSPHHASINHHRGAHGVNENSGNAADSDEEHLYTWRQGALGTSISEVQNRKFRRLAHDEKLQQSLEDVENLLQRLLLRISSATESSSSSVRLDEIRSIRASLEELARYLRERCLKSEVQKPVQR